MFTSNVLMILSSGVSRRDVPDTIPALFTRMETWPTSALVFLAVSYISSLQNQSWYLHHYIITHLLVILTVYSNALLPSFFIMATVSSLPALLMSHVTTVAPNLANLKIFNKETIDYNIPCNLLETHETTNTRSSSSDQHHLACDVLLEHGGRQAQLDHLHDGIVGCHQQPRHNLQYIWYHCTARVSRVPHYTCLY